MPAPVSATRPISTPLTVAAVATGMNSGVFTLPCGVVSTPARAAPSVASSVNEKPGCMQASVDRSPRGVRGNSVNATNRPGVARAIEPA